MHRYLCLIWMAGLLQCGPVQEEKAPPEPPPMDRESWEVKVELHQPDLRVEMQCAHMLDDRDRGISQVDGGLQVAFVGKECRSLLRADRLSLDHERDLFAFGGGVDFRSEGDELRIQSDTLIWKGRSQSIEIPGQARICSPSGWERGRGLRTGYAFRAWSMEWISGRWREEGERKCEVAVRARRERGRREDGSLSMTYDSVEVVSGGSTLRSVRARFALKESRIRFWKEVACVDSTLRLRADELDFDLSEGRMYARKNVSLIHRDWSLSADRMEEDQRKGRLSFEGHPAVFVQEERRIESEHLAYDRRTERLAAEGGVVFREGERRMDMERLDYDRSSDRLRATGAVQVAFPEFKGVLSCDSLACDLRSETGEASGGTVLKREMADGGTFEIRADSLCFDLELKQMSWREGLDLAWDGMTLDAGRGRYDAGTDQFFAGGGASLRQKTDSGDCREIRSDSMLVRIEEGRVEQVALPGKVEIEVEARQGGRTWIEGAQGTIFLSGRRMQRIEVSAAEALHRSGGKKEVCRFRGGRMALYFGGRGLERVRIEGNARLAARLIQRRGKGEEKPLGVNRMEGEKMEIFFEEGEIVRMEMGPDIEGSFYLPKGK